MSVCTRSDGCRTDAQPSFTRSPFITARASVSAIEGSWSPFFDHAAVARPRESVAQIRKNNRCLRPKRFIRILTDTLCS